MYRSAHRLLTLASAPLLALGLLLPAGALACGRPPAGPSHSASAPASVLTSLSLADLGDALAAEGVEDIERVGRTGAQALTFETDGTHVLALLKSDGLIVQLRSAWADTGLGMEAVNAWNSENNFSRAFLDDEGDPALVMEIDITGGVTRERLADALRTYLKLSLPSFERFMVRTVQQGRAVPGKDADGREGNAAQPVARVPIGI